MPGTAFCTQCGTPSPAVSDVDQTDPSEPEPAPVPDSESIEFPTPVADSRPEEHTSTCASCGADIEAGTAFCVSCGTPAAVGASAVTAAAAAKTAIESETTETQDDHEAVDSTSNDPAIEHSEPDDTAPAVAPTRVIPATGSATCRNCDTTLETGARFCIACGTKTGEAPPLAQESETDDSKRSSQSRPFIIAAIVIVAAAMIGASALVGWKQGTNDDEADETALATSTTSTTSTTADDEDPADALPTTTVPPTTVIDEVVCSDLGVRAVDATVALAIAFETVSFDELTAMARIDRTALPGAAAFDAQWASIGAEASESGCDAGAVETAYAAELASSAPPIGANASLVWSAAQSIQETGADPLTQVDSALRPYPIHDPITLAAAVPDAGLPKWVVMLASLNTSDFDRADAQTRADEYTALGLPAEILFTDVYGSLTPGYWAVFTGPFAERDQARDYARSIQATVPDAYQRYVQVLPSTDVPFGQCGPYGMIDVSGVGSNDSVPVLSRPEYERAEIVRLPGTAAGILVAGPAENAGGSWTPIAVNGTIGWIKTQYTTDNSSCPRTDPLVSGVSCPQIATATVDLFKEISDTAAGAGEAGTIPSISPGGFDDAAARLVDQASASGCSGAELNTLLAVDRSRIAPPNPFAELTVQTLYAAPFYRDG